MNMKITIGTVILPKFRPNSVKKVRSEQMTQRDKYELREPRGGEQGEALKPFLRVKGKMPLIWVNS